VTVAYKDGTNYIQPVQKGLFRYNGTSTASDSFYTIAYCPDLNRLYGIVSFASGTSSQVLLIDVGSETVKTFMYLDPKIMFPVPPIVAVNSLIYATEASWDGKQPQGINLVYLGDVNASVFAPFPNSAWLGKTSNLGFGLGLVYTPGSPGVLYLPIQGWTMPNNYNLDSFWTLDQRALTFSMIASQNWTGSILTTFPVAMASSRREIYPLDTDVLCEWMSIASLQCWSVSQQARVQKYAFTGAAITMPSFGAWTLGFN